MNRLIKNYYFWLAVACLAVYLPSLWNDFQTSWDDQWMVVNRYTKGGYAHVRTYAWKNSETLKRGYWEMINFKPSKSEDEQPKHC